MEYCVKKVPLYNLYGLTEASRILYLCGVDMFQKDGLEHWHNSKLKTFLICIYSALKNKVYLVLKDDKAVATFQIHSADNTAYFCKLAVEPSFGKSGIGSFCLKFMENLAKRNGCAAIGCDVFSKSLNAIGFYEYHGYKIVGEKNTLKYTEFIMKKELV